jgi:hypothetical protein
MSLICVLISVKCDMFSFWLMVEMLEIAPCQMLPSSLVCLALGSAIDLQASQQNRIMLTFTHDGPNIRTGTGLSRRDFLRIGVPAGLTLSAGVFPLATASGAGMDKGAKTLAKLKGASLTRKAKLLQEVLKSTRSGASGSKGCFGISRLQSPQPLQEGEGRRTLLFVGLRNRASAT